MFEELILVVSGLIGLATLYFLAKRSGGLDKGYRRVTVRGKTRAISFGDDGRIRHNKTWSIFTKQNLAKARVKKEIKNTTLNVFSPTKNINRIKKAKTVGTDFGTMSGLTGIQGYGILLLVFLIILLLLFSKIL